jgi:FkbM family methyltransferase
MIKNKQKFAVIHKRNGLKKAILAQEEVIIYGGGTVGRDVISVLEKKGINVKCILDAKGLKLNAINGIPILKPDDAQFSVSLKKSTYVIVSIFNAYVYMPAIHSQLKKNGWDKVIPFLDFYDDFAAELGNRYWLTKKEYYTDHKNNVGKAFSLLTDEKSKDLFRKIVNFRLAGDYELLDNPDEGTQYFPVDIPPWEKDLRIIDCGAYDGDTLKKVHSLGINLNAYAGFEPDPSNFLKLSEAISSGNSDASYTIWPCGVWSHTCQLKFASGHGSGSNISQSGDLVIQCTSLDESLPTFQPNLIKMDIEGAEYNALLGSTKTIHKYRPGMAICLYHEPAHLWKIPFLISSWNLNYAFYLRCHCFNGFELVLYAIPR